MSQKYFITAAAFAALLLPCSPTYAITANLSAAKDNTLYETANGNLSNGAGNGLFVGRTQQGFEDVRRALLMFDVASQLPSEAIVTNATLTLKATAAAGSQLPDAVELYRVDTDWGEAGSIAVGGSGGGGAGGPAQSGDATWLHSFSHSTNWTNLGGDYSTTLSASQSVSGPGSYTWSSSQLTEDIQDMLATPNDNFGWILLGNEMFAETAKRFGSRESNNTPMLTIEYDLPGGLGPDFDGDGDVDGDDLDDWANGYGTGSGGDADNDGDTDGTDYLAWQSVFTGPAGLQTAEVPEPSSGVLLVGLLALSALNRRGDGSCWRKAQK